MILTCWQIQIENEWKYATVELAVLVALHRPGCVRLSAMKAPSCPRFERMGLKYVHKITPRRIAAAKRRLRKEREAVPLFAEHVASAQPSPEERIKRIDESVRVRFDHMRSLRASNWRRVRDRLRKLPGEVRAHVLLEHAEMKSPGTPEALGYVIDKWCRSDSTSEGVAA